MPFLIAIGVFGVVAYKGVKEIIELASSEVVTTDDHKIAKMNYVLRADATDVQLEYFTELKNAIEVNDAEDDEIAGLVCKNFVAAFVLSFPSCVLSFLSCVSLLAPMFE